jgi:hypothetical protein
MPVEEAAAQRMRAVVVEFQLFHDERAHALLDLAIERAGAGIKRVVEIEDPGLYPGERRLDGGWIVHELSASSGSKPLAAKSARVQSL